GGRVSAQVGPGLECRATRHDLVAHEVRPEVAHGSVGRLARERVRSAGAALIEKDEVARAAQLGVRLSKTEAAARCGAGATGEVEHRVVGGLPGRTRNDE